MAKAKLQRGETTAIVYYVKELGDTWRAYSTRPKNYRATSKTKWRAQTKLRVGYQTKLESIYGYGDTKAAATRQLEKKLERARELDGFGKASKDTLGMCVQRIVTDIEEGRDPTVKSPRTVEKYEGVSRLYLQSSGNSQIASIAIVDLTVADLNREAMRLHNDGHTSTLRHWRALIMKALQRAVDEGTLSRNIARDMRNLPRKQPSTKIYQNGAPRTRNDVLTPKEIKRIVDTAYSIPYVVAAGTADLLHVSVFCGLRMAEIGSLRWADVDFTNNHISINGQFINNHLEHKRVYMEITKSAMSRRTIPLPDEAMKIFRRRFDEITQRPHEKVTDAERTYVFSSARGGEPKIDTFYKHVRKVFDKAGVRTGSLHSIRRTVENGLVRGGVNLVDVELFMGHTQAVAHASYWDKTSVPTSTLQTLRSFDPSAEDHTPN